MAPPHGELVQAKSAKHSVAQFFTLCFHYGGTSYQTPQASYVGGQVEMYSMSCVENVTLGAIRIITENIRSSSSTNPGKTNFHVIDGANFVLLQTDSQVQEYCRNACSLNNMLNVYLDVITIDEWSMMFQSDDDEDDSEFLCNDNVEDDFDDDMEYDEHVTTSCLDTGLGLGIVEGDEVGSRRVDVREDREGTRVCDSEDDSGSDIVDSDREFEELIDSEEDGNGGNKVPYLAPCDIRKPIFEIGMMFATRNDFKKAVENYAIHERRGVRFTKIDKRRIYAKCDDADCDWAIHALKVENGNFQISLYSTKHRCDRRYDVPNMKSTWVSENYAGRFKSDPNRDLEGFRVDLIREINVNVTKNQIYSAKRKALKLLEGDSVAQYALLWEYAAALRESNPGSTVILGVTEDNRFDKFYVCLAGTMKGWKEGCRPILGVDGCHLRGPYGGVLLTAVGIDASDNPYPVAYAAVGKECGETWRWFLNLLRNDLELFDGRKITFMSDKQKGLIQAFDEIFPGTAHRFCVRHLHNNFQKAGHKGLALKSAFWKCARASTPAVFEKRMDELQVLSVEAHGWLKEKPPSQWSLSHFTSLSTCDILLNNICEAWNAVLVPVRGKGIISLMEGIREKMMGRMQSNRDRSKMKWMRKNICPKILKKVQRNKDRVVDCIPIKCSNIHYQISTFDGAQYAIDLERQTCTCRRWQLSGIPCPHACCAIVNQRRRPEEFVDHWYSVEKYDAAYAPVIKAVPSQHFWNKTPFEAPLPPNTPRGVGRPGSLRKRGSDEKQLKVRKDKGLVRLKKHQITLKCGKCGIAGHNRRRCPQLIQTDEASQHQERDQGVGLHESLDDDAPLFQSHTAQEGHNEASLEYEEDCPSQLFNDSQEERPTQSSQVSSKKVKGPSMYAQLHGFEPANVMQPLRGPSTMGPPPGLTPLFSTRPAQPSTMRPSRLRGRKNIACIEEPGKE